MNGWAESGRKEIEVHAHRSSLVRPVEHGGVLYDDQGVAGRLFKNGHELKDLEGSADLQVLGCIRFKIKEI